MTAPAPQKTQGISPKVPAQAFATIVTFVIARYGIEIDTEVSGAIATLIGFGAGFITPPGTVVANVNQNPGR